MITPTTSVTLTPWAERPIQGTEAKRGSNRWAMVAPPTAPLRMPIRVMPICTVERKSFGALASFRAAPALRLPRSACCSSRTLRAETTAISEPEKMPLAMISTRISRPSISSPEAI